MLTTPVIEQRPEQHYVAIRKIVKQNEIGAVLPPLSGEVETWMQARNIKPSGAPFFR
ncbi:MAG: AraC family transcriptional regulator, partial [Chitinophagaceae bacterium]|nr:AraC family transcriptional regulator [Chitinophagaceae bacterium]